MQYMPMYWGDYLKDTSHLTMSQHGAYLLLLAHCWNKGKLPAMLKQCYSIAKAMDKQSQSDVEAVLNEFFILDVECYRHKRVEAEFAKAVEGHEKRVNAGKKGAEARKNKSSNASSNASAMRKHPYPDPYPYPDKSKPSYQAEDELRGVEA